MGNKSWRIAPISTERFRTIGISKSVMSARPTRLQAKKKALFRALLFWCLVELAGVEPASENLSSLVLHA